MKIAVKIGGSLCIGEHGPEKKYLSGLLPVLKKIKKRNQLIVSIGGGKLVRNYFKNAEGFKMNRHDMEWAAIEILQANVRFLASLLGMKPIFSLEEIDTGTSGVIGGIKPGRSTDANAAYAAAKIKANLFIKMTNVGGIYNKDPKKYRNARKLDRIPFKDLRKFSRNGKPGSYGILDALAIEIIAKNKIKTVVISGKNPKDVLKAISGKKIGTLISD